MRNAIHFFLAFFLFQTAGKPQLTEHLAQIDRERTGRAGDMDVIETRALDLLKPDSTEKDKAEVYRAIAVMYANDGMRHPAKVAEYCEKALGYDTDILKACQLYLYWGEALESQNRQAIRLETTKSRKESSVPYVKGLEIVAKNLTDGKKRDVPPVGRYRYDGPKTDTGYEVMLKKQSDEEAARKKVLLQNELIDYRKMFSEKCAALFPQGVIELEEAVAVVIKDRETARKVVADIQFYRPRKPATAAEQ